MEEIKKEDKCAVGCCKLSKDTIIWVLAGLLVLTIGIAISLSLCDRGEGFRKFHSEGCKGQMNKGHERGEMEGKRNGEGRMMQNVDNNQYQAKEGSARELDTGPQIAPILQQ